jgi:hypothetical protein
MKTLKDMPAYCEKCGRRLKPKDIVYLELDMRDNTLHLPENKEVPETFSQGCFAFGKACADIILKLEEARRIK